MEWESVIGLEIHAQLATKSKIFSATSTAYGAEPNRQASLIDLGYPGVLPVINAEVIRMAVMFGLAINGRIASHSIFARKNYFYPDLPKGYQISQYEQPIVTQGWIDIDIYDVTKKIGITRAHLEEDAGKSVHDLFEGETGIDLNRAGTPLLEIVSEPDLRSAAEAVAYMRRIHSLVRYLRICDGNMQEGSFRCDANVSIRPKGKNPFGTRTEIKNINSFRFVEKAIEFEIDRQIEVLEAGGKIIQETRLFDATKNETRPMRQKEEANDYRYFPDPDLLPVEIEQALIDDVASSLPELPEQKLSRFKQKYNLREYDAARLAADRDVADYFEAVVEASNGEAKLAANWITSELWGVLNRQGLEISESPVSARNLGTLISRITDGTISSKIAKQVFEQMCSSESGPDEIIQNEGLVQVTDSALIEQLIAEVLAESPEQVQQYRDGKTKMIGYFVGQVMKKSQGKADPAKVNALIRDKLG
jgi:aspartyl-tRNA(Asn)/glutamyl-tRNA(Gln) amidotransferase subunit B